MPSPELHPQAATYFRDGLREARAAALRDVEKYSEILFAIERLGRYLNPRGRGLGHYYKSIASVVEPTALSQAVATERDRLHMPFGPLYKVVQEARNSALHEGAFARHLTARSIELALLIEDALTTGMGVVGDFMVRGPAIANVWQPLSFIRQTMLANSFSFLPVRLQGHGADGWHLVSDHALATYLRSAESPKERQERLAEALESAVRSSRLTLRSPFTCTAECSISEALAKCDGLPVLVRGEREEDLLGIVTPFDLL
jgi:hypothetical protein